MTAGTSGNLDTSKENDCIKPSSSLIVPISIASSSTQNPHAQPMKSQQISVLKVTPTINKSSGSGKMPAFLKKESLVNKKKILRENITTTLVNQIPHKKIRVSSNATNSNAINSSPDKESYVNDSEMPCCSRSTTSYMYQKAPSSPGSSSSSSNGQMKITTFMPIKKIAVVKYGASNNPKAPASTLKKSRNVLEHQSTTENSLSTPTFHSLSEKLIKKKKRLLKPETTLKRKKSRPQKPLV